LALFWYGMVPIVGAQISRHGWRRFRRYFDRLRLAPLLDYARYVGCGRIEGTSPPQRPRIFRFTGGFESITDGHTLWVRGPDLTIPVVITGAQTYMLPMGEGDGGGETFDFREEVPRRLRWDRAATLTAEARVFVGGALVPRDDRWTFASTPETPLQVIFYTGSERSMAIRTIRTGRHQNEYWNGITPYALALGVLNLIAMAVSFLPRPAFRLTAITAFIAAFIPLFPLVPPGLLCTIAYRWLWRKARIYRARRDLARLPLVYFPGPLEGPGGPCSPALLPGPPGGGEPYGVRCYQELPEGIPLLAPGMKKGKKERWYVFGVLDREGIAGGETEPAVPPVPREPEDSFATFGALPGNPEKLARRCTAGAYALEVLSWILLLGGIGLNALFIMMIITLL
jgi:hypothetical protein